MYFQYELVAIDTVYCNTPDIEDVSTSYQLFVGKDTLLTDVYSMKSEKPFSSTVADNIRQRGAMDKINFDRAKVEISNKVKDILRALFIDLEE